MRRDFLLLGCGAGVLALMLLAGCGGGSSTSGAGRDGSLTMVIEFPSASASQTPTTGLPSETQSVKVIVRPLPGPGGEVTRCIPRPPTADRATVLIENLPAGPYRVTGEAYGTTDCTGMILASASTDVTVIAGEVTPVDLLTAPTTKGAQVTTFWVKDGTTELILPDGLTEEHFSVSLNWGSGPVPSQVLGVTQERTGGLDLVFVIDTSASMYRGVIEPMMVEPSTLARVLPQIALRLESLGGSAVRFGGVEYSAVIRTHKHLTESLSDFQAWLQSLMSPTHDWAPDYGGPERALEAIIWAKENLAWRQDAMRTFVIVTDSGAINSESTARSAAPRQAQDVKEALKGWAVVHTISPQYDPWYEELYGYDLRDLSETTGGATADIMADPLNWGPLKFYERFRYHYTVTYRAPTYVTTPTEVTLRATYGGKSGVRVFPGVTWP